MIHSTAKNGKNAAVSLPFLFEFRRRQIEWTRSIARIVGWARSMDGSIDEENLFVQVQANGVSRRFRYPLEKLPRREWDNFSTETRMDKDVERAFSNFELSVLLPSRWIYTSECSEQGEPADAWEMRDDFLGIQPNSESCLAFLRRWGQWSRLGLVQVSDVASLQSAVRQGMSSSPSTWFQSDYVYSPTWRRRSEYPWFGMLTDTAEVALRMTVTIDLLNEVKFKKCARIDCGQLFAESRRDRRFCSRDCAHIEAVRRSRKKVGSDAKDKEALSNGTRF